MAKPKLALIPAAQGSKFYSVLPSDGVGDFDFARASAATRINKYGLIETVASGQSRLNYPLIDGVVNGCPHHILEPARTNLITYSEDFSNAYWTKINSTITSNASISPDGSLNADKLVEDTSTGSHRVDSIEWIFITGGTTVTQSVYVKANGRTIVGLQDNALGAGHAVFNLSTATVLEVYGVSAKIETLADGWFRISYTFVSGGVGSQPYKTGIYALDTYTSGAPLANTYTGDGTSGIYIWGAQLEAGSYPTSYIVSNSGSATTRVAETANNSGDASTFNDSEGVLMVEGSIAKDENVFRNISISDGSSNNFVTFYTTNVLNKITYLLGAGGGGAVFGLDYYFQDITINFKIALVYSSGRNEIWVNGIKVNQNTDTFSSMSGLNELSFDNGVSGGNWYGNTKQIQYFDSALNDSELETLTSWTSFSEMATSQLYSIQ
jgi:hypothetical protein